MKTAQKERITFRKTNIRFIIFITFIIFIFVFNSQAYAQASRSFTISPPTIKFSLKPGQKDEKIIKIINHSSEPLEFVVNMIDLIVQDKKGTPELLPAGVKMDNKFAASFWTAIIPDRIVVQPRETETTTLYLQIPGDARPGGRYVSAAFRPTGNGNPDGSGAAVNTVVGSLVYITVEGKMQESARVEKLFAPLLSEYGPIKIETEIKNTGDIHISPKGSIVIKDFLGRKIDSSILESLNVFPGTSRIFTNYANKKFLFGRFTAKLDGYYGLKNNLPLMAVACFWVIPYKLILIALIIVAVSVWLSRYLQKRQEKLMEVKEEETTPKKK